MLHTFFNIAQSTHNKTRFKLTDRDAPQTWILVITSTRVRDGIDYPAQIEQASSGIDEKFKPGTEVTLCRSGRIMDVMLPL